MVEPGGVLAGSSGVGMESILPDVFHVAIVETQIFFDFVAVRARMFFMTVFQDLLKDGDVRKRVIHVLGVHRSTVHRWQTGKRFPERWRLAGLVKLFPALTYDDIYPHID